MASPEEIREGWGFYYYDHMNNEGPLGLMIFVKFGVRDTTREPIYCSPRFFQFFMGFLSIELRMGVALIAPQDAKSADLLAVFYKNTPPELLVPEFFGIKPVSV